MAASAPPFWPATLVDYAQVVSAIATAAAVIVSLYLATRRPVPELQGFAGIKTLVSGPGAARPEFLHIRVTNVGQAPATVTTVGWRVPHWYRKKRLHAYQDVSTVPTSALRNPALPATLQHGEQLDFWLPLSGSLNWLDGIERHGIFAEHLTTRKSLKRLRAVVYASVGDGTEIELDSNLLDSIWAAQEKYLAAREAATSPV